MHTFCSSSKNRPVGQENCSILSVVAMVEQRMKRRQLIGLRNRSVVVVLVLKPSRQRLTCQRRRESERRVEEVPSCEMLRFVAETCHGQMTVASKEAAASMLSSPNALTQALTVGS